MRHDEALQSLEERRMVYIYFIAIRRVLSWYPGPNTSDYGINYAPLLLILYHDPALPARGAHCQPT